MMDRTNKKQAKPELNTLLYGKVPPQVPDLEEAVLAACMLERDTFDIVIEILPHEEIFYVDAHQKIYAAMLSLYHSGRAIDLLTITEQLRKTNTLEFIGDSHYLTKLTTAVLSSAHVQVHAIMVYEKYMQREMIRVSAAVIGDAYKPDTDVFDLLESAQKGFQVIADIPGAKQSLHISQSAIGVMQDILDNRDSDGHITGIPTGYPTMDQKMYGWQKTDLTILAARPSVGKTAFALNLAFNGVNNPFKKVAAAIFSLEMGNRRITKRGLAFTAKIDLGLINRPKELSVMELQLLQNAVSKLGSMKIYLDDTAILTTTNLRNKCRKMMKKHPDHEWIFIIDYLQLMTSTDTKGNRENQVSQISRGLKLIAKELDTSIIALSQLNRIDNDDEPDLKNLRESGAIEQDADNVMFLFQPSGKLIKENAYYANKIMLKGAKFRDGETFLLPLQFDKQFQLFTEPQREYKSMGKPLRTDQADYNAVPTATSNYSSDKDDIPF